MPQVFISYSSSDSIFADLLKMKLQAAGIDAWLDRGELEAGEEWRNAIDEGISSTEALILVLTPESCDSPYVTYEWGFALGRRKKVIPLLFKDSDIHPRLEVLQYIDFRDHKALPWDKLIARIPEETATSDPEPTYVKDMTYEELQKIISGAIALSNATEKSTGQKVDSDNISSSTFSMVEAVQSPSLRTRQVSPRRILWVDDKPDNNRYERNALEAIGYEFSLAYSTDEALRLMSSQNFDAVISDMARKEGRREGYVLLKALRGFDITTPYFIYAGSNASKEKLNAKNKGAQGLTNRPDELIQLVSQFVE